MQASTAMRSEDYEASPVLRVLVVDDESNHRRSLAIGLRLAGFEVQEAPDGATALEMLADASFEAAVVDLMMPGMNGLELARRIRFRHEEVRVVLTSAYHLTERQLERADVGCIGFVPKPYRIDELAAFIRGKLTRTA